MDVVLAFIVAHEEQRRRTLHSQWQVFSKQLSTETLSLLFNKDDDEKLEARKNLARVDLFMESSFGVEPISMFPDGFLRQRMVLVSVCPKVQTQKDA